MKDGDQEDPWTTTSDDDPWAATGEDDPRAVSGEISATENRDSEESAEKSAADVVAGEIGAKEASDGDAAATEAGGGDLAFKEEGAGGDGSRKKRDGGRKVSLRAMVILGLLVVSGIGIAIFVVAGMFHSQHVYVVCKDGTMQAMRGSRLVWGKTALEGDMWRPVALAAGAPCESREVASLDALGKVMATALVHSAEAKLATGTDEDLTAASEQVAQATMLTEEAPGSPLSVRIKRVGGDITYRNAAAKVAAAAAALDEAAKAFAKAGAANPLHHHDAARWATLAAELKGRLAAGPAGKKAATHRPVPLTHRRPTTVPSAAATPSTATDPSPATTPGANAAPDQGSTAQPSPTTKPPSPTTGGILL
ncbi:MAG TPA: hypothetical protein VFG83_12090 [Kofleriaceae bacterium]|nr:hypothetical protein [Kofleriaceae bacterium]